MLQQQFEAQLSEPIPTESLLDQLFQHLLFGLIAKN
jgi:hypothetical protein